jgi:diguanylate cyclase (GGDEF)-like protein
MARTGVIGHSPPMDTVGGDGDKILFVDDEPAIRVLVARQLSRLGFTPVVAATAEEALALSENEHFRVVIADLEMSGMGGLALLQRLSPLQPQARFLVLTGRGAVAGELLPRGHRIRVFQKPWDERELAAAVRGTDAVSTSSFPPMAREEWPITNVLLIEPDETAAFEFCADLDTLHPGEFATTVASDVAIACSLSEHHSFDIIALSLPRTDVTGLEAIARLQSEAPHIGIVVIAPADDATFEVRAIQAGAQDCLIRARLDASNWGRALRHAIERKRAEWRLASIAFHDPLTGLANRSLFRQRVAQAAAFAKRSRSHFGVLVLDLDRFKFVNDSLGHDAGDAFLQEIAHRLQIAMRETDTVARLGGDEFAVLATPLQSPEDIEPLSERILGELRRPIDVGGTRLYPTASIGAALFPDSGGDSDSLLSAADAALYVVKDSGRNGYHIHGMDLRVRTLHRLKLEEQVRQAVELEQFRMHYQPQFSLETGFLGAEALLRWEPSPGVTLEANEFMSILEDTGLIVKLGPWILETACNQLRKWRDGGLWVDRMAINISGRQVTGRDFGSSLRKIARAAGIQCSDVELELTESALSRNKDTLQAGLAELAADGCRLALDNFGTGYCSLGYLKNFSITTLKLDKSFVQGIAINQHDRRWSGGIIRLVNTLGLDVIAEGVETAEQLALLRAEGCHIAQGHWLGSAMAPDEFEIAVRTSAFRRTDEPAHSGPVSCFVSSDSEPALAPGRPKGAAG